MKRLHLLLLVLLAVTTRSEGQITIIGHWRLGEADVGAVAGNVTISSPSINSAQSAYHLTKEGVSPYYDADTPSSLLTPAGTSTLSMSFNGAATGYGGYYVGLSGSGGSLPVSTQNFALEAWIKPANTNVGARVIATVGDKDSGYALVQSGTALEVRFGSGASAVITYSGLATTGWTHVALVRDTTTATMYVNGASEGFSNATIGAFAASSEYFGIGEQPAGGGSQNFVGLIDEVRYFTYTGTFDASMLNYTAVPEPATSAVLAALAVLGVTVWLRPRPVGGS